MESEQKQDEKRRGLFLILLFLNFSPDDKSGRVVDRSGGSAQPVGANPIYAHRFVTRRA